MWIFTEYGFFSVTQTTRRADEIQIRARHAEHLENLKDAFPILDRCPISETPENDYRFRIIVKRWKWEKLGAELTAAIHYSNFKGQCSKAGRVKSLINTLHDVWSLMYAFQRKMNPVDPMAGEPKLFREAGDPLLTGDWDIQAHIDAEDAARRPRKGGKR